MAPPPGIRLLLSSAPRLVLPPILAVVLLRIYQYVADTKLAFWITPVAAILSLPIAFTMSVQWLEFRDRRAAAALGAQLPPTIEYKMPGGFDLLQDMRKDNEGRFPGTLYRLHILGLLSVINYTGYRIMEWAAKYGSVCNFRVYFENRVRVMIMDRRSFDEPYDRS